MGFEPTFHYRRSSSRSSFWRTVKVWGSLINSRPPQPSTLLFRYEAKAKFSLRSLFCQDCKHFGPTSYTLASEGFSGAEGIFNEEPPHLDKYIVPQFVVFVKGKRNFFYGVSSVCWSGKFRRPALIFHSLGLSPWQVHCTTFRDICQEVVSGVRRFTPFFPLRVGYWFLFPNRRIGFCLTISLLTFCIIAHCALFVKRFLKLFLFLWFFYNLGATQARPLG